MDQQTRDNLTTALAALYSLAIYDEEEGNQMTITLTADEGMNGAELHQRDVYIRPYYNSSYPGDIGITRIQKQEESTGNIVGTEFIEGRITLDDLNDYLQGETVQEIVVIHGPDVHWST